jgi:hypothetical protein
MRNTLALKNSKRPLENTLLGSAISVWRGLDLFIDLIFANVYSFLQATIRRKSLFSSGYTYQRERRLMGR